MREQLPTPKSEPARRRRMERVREEGRRLRREMLERTLGFITGALGFVAGLAWNDAFKAAIDYLFPLDKEGLSAKFLYAAGVTILVVVLSMYLVRLLSQKEEQKP